MCRLAGPGFGEKRPLSHIHVLRGICASLHGTGIGGSGAAFFLVTFFLAEQEKVTRRRAASGIIAVQASPQAIQHGAQAHPTFRSRLSPE
jgi:hypothetical protein